MIVGLIDFVVAEKELGQFQSGLSVSRLRLDRRAVVLFGVVETVYAVPHVGMEQQHRHVAGFPLERSFREINRLVQVINVIGSLSKGFEDQRRIRMILVEEVAEITSGGLEIALLSAKHGNFEQISRSSA